MTAFTIEAMRDGGYAVVDCPRDPSSYIGAVYCATTIDEALAYVKAKMQPKALLVPEGCDLRPGRVTRQG